MTQIDEIYKIEKKKVGPGHYKIKDPGPKDNLPKQSDVRRTWIENEKVRGKETPGFQYNCDLDKVKKKSIHY